MRFRLALSSAVLLASCADVRSFPDNMSNEQAFAYCGTKFGDFRWSHEFSGTIYIAPTGSLSPAQISCMDRWASRSQHRYIFLSGTFPLDESDVRAKAEACGFDPKNLHWRETEKGRRAAISGYARDPVTREMRCMLDWADRIDAPLDLVVRKVNDAAPN